MGSDRTSIDPDDADDFHQERVRTDLAIIQAQAQAQLLLRRTVADRPADPDDLHRRLALIVEAVQRLTLAHQ